MKKSRIRKPLATKRTQTKASRESPGPSQRAHEQHQAKLCRDFIIAEVVEKKRVLAIRSLAKQFGRSIHAVRNDVAKFFAPKGFPIRLENHQFVHDDTRLTTEGRREFENKSAKTKIGKLGSLLIAGPERVPAMDDQSVANFTFAPDPSRPLPAVLANKLDAYLTKAHRLAILDSGSTNLAIANALVDVKTPAPRRHLNFLRVLTNGRRVAQALDAPESTHKIILLGGALRRDTQAVAGLLAERCLESWLIHTADLAIADIAIIGTTNVNENFDLFSDSEIESEMKSRLLNSARIRCICADSHKLMRRSGGSWAFCAFTSSMIDLVLTDDEILVPQKSPIFEEGRTRFLSRAQQEGIYVAVAR